MGLAKAKQSAGQRAMDLTKQLSKLDGLALDDLLRVNGAALKERGVPTQERKRILKFTDKVRNGWAHDGRTGTHAWRGWKPPLHDLPR